MQNEKKKKKQLIKCYTIPKSSSHSSSISILPVKPIVNECEHFGYKKKERK